MKEDWNGNSVKKNLFNKNINTYSKNYYKKITGYMYKIHN